MIHREVCGPFPTPKGYKIGNRLNQRANILVLDTNSRNGIGSSKT